MSAIVVSLIVSLIAIVSATAMAKTRSTKVDMLFLAPVAIILAFATLAAYAHVSTWDNKELDQGYVCKRVVSALGDWGFQWAPARSKYSVMETLGACTSPMRTDWEASYWNRLADGAVALSRLDKILEVSGVSMADRRDIVLAEDEIWDEARNYKH